MFQRCQDDDGGSTHLRNVGLLQDYTALYPRKMSSFLIPFGIRPSIADAFWNRVFSMLLTLYEKVFSMLLTLPETGCSVCCWRFLKQGVQYAADAFWNRVFSMLLTLYETGCSVCCGRFLKQGVQYAADVFWNRVFSMLLTISETGCSVCCWHYLKQGVQYANTFSTMLWTRI
jgi:hypothetical protein